MKKVLLGFLLLMLCSARGFAANWWKVNCYQKINGEYVIKMFVNTGFDETNNNLDVAVFFGPSPCPYPSASNYVGVFQEDNASTYIDLLTGWKVLVYKLPASFRPEGCLWVIAAPSYGNPPLTGPVDELAASIWGCNEICPCPPCDARFSYCVKEGATPGTWDVTFNLYNQPAVPSLFQIGINGYTDPSNPFFDISQPVQFTDGTYRICIALYDRDGYVMGCSYCIELCLGTGKDPLKQPKTKQAQPGISGDYSPEVKIYPNPASNISKMEFSLLQDEPVTIELIDISGHVISTIKDEIAAKGYHAVDINTAGVPAGMYIVRMKTGNSVSNYRLSVIK